MKVDDLTSSPKKFNLLIVTGRLNRERNLGEKALMALDPVFMSNAQKNRALKLDVKGILTYANSDDLGKTTIYVTRTK